MVQAGHAQHRPLCPPRPQNVPPGLTEPSRRYRRLTQILALKVLLFVLVYLFATAVSLWFAYRLFTMGMPSPGLLFGFKVLVQYGSAAAFALVGLYLAKMAVRCRKWRLPWHTELTEENAPQLWSFLQRVSQELGAPAPARVFVTHEVTAAIVYDLSALNLLVPPRGHLVIGLGLLNVTNLSEFKAVLAHELAHFSRHSGFLHSYIIAAARTVQHLVYGEDPLDRLLQKWAALPIPLSLPALIVLPMVAVLVTALQALYGTIERTYLALSREQEYEADAIAISVAGSEAVAGVLARTDYAGRCLEVTKHYLDLAADVGLFSRDLFTHHAYICSVGLRSRGRIGQLPRPRDPRELARESEQEDPDSTHPPLSSRVRRVLQWQVACPMDDRPAWLLFEGAESVRVAVTLSFYRDVLGVRKAITLQEPESGQRFIRGELEVAAFLGSHKPSIRVESFYPGYVEDQPAPSPAELRAYFAHWPPDESETQQAEALVEQRRWRCIELLSQAELAGRHMEPDERRRLQAATNLLARAETAWNEAVREEHDRFMRMHLAVARELDARAGQQRYVPQLLAGLRFQRWLADRQSLLRQLEDQSVLVLQRLLRIVGSWYVFDATVEVFCRSVSEFQTAFYRFCEQLKDRLCPPLVNVPRGADVYELVARPVLARLGKARAVVDNDDSAAEVLTVMHAFFRTAAAMERIAVRLTRLRELHLASLLNLCERLRTEWLNKPHAVRGQPAD